MTECKGCEREVREVTYFRPDDDSETFGLCGKCVEVIGRYAAQSRPEPRANARPIIRIGKGLDHVTINGHPAAAEALSVQLTESGTRVTMTLDATVVH